MPDREGRQAQLTRERPRLADRRQPPELAQAELEVEAPDHERGARARTLGLAGAFGARALGRLTGLAARLERLRDARDEPVARRGAIQTEPHRSVPARAARTDLGRAAGYADPFHAHARVDCTCYATRSG